MAPFGPAGAGFAVLLVAWTHGVVPQWSLGTIYKGMFEFMFIQVVCLLLLILLPEIALWLPRVMRG